MDSKTLAIVSCHLSEELQHYDEATRLPFQTYAITVLLAACLLRESFLSSIRCRHDAFGFRHAALILYDPSITSRRLQLHTFAYCRPDVVNLLESRTRGLEDLASGEDGSSNSGGRAHHRQPMALTFRCNALSKGNTGDVHPGVYL